MGWDTGQFVRSVTRRDGNGKSGCPNGKTKESWQSRVVKQNTAVQEQNEKKRSGSNKKKANGLTKPFMQLPDPCLTSLFDGRIEENHLVLNANLVDDWLEDQRAFDTLF